MNIRQIQHNRPLISVQDMVNFIDKGEEYKKKILEDEKVSENFDYLYSIILTPDYQRQYRATVQEESSIIESLIVGIPIPEVFLVKTNDTIRLRHVMDGQHRLNAIYRFIKGKFKLKNLEILDLNAKKERIPNPEFEGKNFSELSPEYRIKILGSHISVLEFESMEDDELEIELFKRYNKNSKPLEAQEISMATYFSKTSQFISNFITNCYDYSDKNISKVEEYTNIELEKLKIIYNITQNRKNKQKNHQEICILLNVLENGPKNISYNKDGVEISTDYLKKKAEQYKKNNSENLSYTKDEFRKFNDFILALSDKIYYPMSTEIVRSGSHKVTKYHVGISITLATIYYLYEIDIRNSNLVADVQTILRNSPVGDSEFRASTTQLKTLLEYLLVENEIHKMSFSALKLKEDRLDNLLS